MGLENLLSKTKKGIASAALSLAMVSPMYGCGDEETVVYKETVGGVYAGQYEVTDDPQDMIAPADELGRLEVDVVPRNMDEVVRLQVFERKDYERGDDGRIDNAWNNLWGETLHVYGTIVDDKLDLNASVDGVNLWTGEEFFVNWKVTGDKQPYVPEETAAMSRALRLQDYVRR